MTTPGTQSAAMYRVGAMTKPWRPTRYEGTAGAVPPKIAWAVLYDSAKPVKRTSGGKRS
jgi:hypothetical protein